MSKYPSPSKQSNMDSKKQTRSEEPKGTSKLSAAENGHVDITRPWKSGGSFPPPLSCLRSFKTGRPYTYIRFNDDDDSFVLEEIRIPTQYYFRAHREDGRLKLYYINQDDEVLEEAVKEEDKSEEEGNE